MNVQIKITIAMATMICLMMADKASAQPECGYEVVIVHPDPCGPLGPPSAGGRGINSFGHVAGHHEKCNQLDAAFLWTPETGMVDLQMPDGALRSRAWDVNNDGWTVGWVTFSGDDLGRLGFLHDGRSAISLGTLPGGNFSQATSINNAGQITGFWGNNVNGNPSAEVFIWENGRMTGLGPDIGGVSSRGSSINEEGAITGWWRREQGSDRLAFVWQDGVVTNLGPILDGFSSEGRAINSKGDVAGWGWKFDKEYQQDKRCAFLWTSGRMIDLGALPGHTESTAVGVNNARQVIGFSSNFGSNGSWFIWQNGVMTDLNDLVPPEFTVASANAINNQGIIAGAGNGAEGGFPGMALLIPQPRPIGDLDLDCEIDLDDLRMLLDNWGACDECTGDLDENGIVNTQDLLILFSNWG